MKLFNAGFVTALALCAGAVAMAGCEIIAAVDRSTLDDVAASSTGGGEGGKGGSGMGGMGGTAGMGGMGGMGGTAGMGGVGGMGGAGGMGGMGGSGGVAPECVMATDCPDT